MISTITEFSNINIFTPIILILSIIALCFSIISFNKVPKNKINSERYTSQYLIIILLSSMLLVCSFLSMLTNGVVRESSDFTYKLKKPLIVNVDYGYKDKLLENRDSQNLKILDNNNQIKTKEKIEFAAGENINLKIIEQVPNSERKDWDWHNARVFVYIDEILCEVSNDDIKDQEIDKIIENIYKQNKNKVEKKVIIKS